MCLIPTHAYRQLGIKSEFDILPKPDRNVDGGPELEMRWHVDGAHLSDAIGIGIHVPHLSAYNRLMKVKDWPCMNLSIIRRCSTF
jgi:hypothetical protein